METLHERRGTFQNKKDATKTRSLIFHATWRLTWLLLLLLLVIQINQCFAFADSAVALLDQMRKVWGKSWITVFHIQFQSEPSAVGAKVQLFSRRSDSTAHSGCRTLVLDSISTLSSLVKMLGQTTLLYRSQQSDKPPFNNEVGCVILCGRKIICRRLWLWGLSSASLIISKNVSVCVCACAYSSTLSHLMVACLWTLWICCQPESFMLQLSPTNLTRGKLRNLCWRDAHRDKLCIL